MGVLQFVGPDQPLTMDDSGTVLDCTMGLPCALELTGTGLGDGDWLAVAEECPAEEDTARLVSRGCADDDGEEQTFDLAPLSASSSAGEVWQMCWRTPGLPTGVVTESARACSYILIFKLLT